LIGTLEVVDLLRCVIPFGVDFSTSVVSSVDIFRLLNVLSPPPDLAITSRDDDDVLLLFPEPCCVWSPLLQLRGVEEQSFLRDSCSFLQLLERVFSSIEIPDSRVHQFLILNVGAGLVRPII